MTREQAEALLALLSAIGEDELVRKSEAADIDFHVLLAGLDALRQIADRTQALA
jgi:hypothetical protein